MCWLKLYRKGLLLQKTVPQYSHIPLPQFVLNVSLIKNVPLAVLHQEHDNCSVMTTIAPVKHSPCLLTFKHYSGHLVTLNSPHISLAIVSINYFLPISVVKNSDFSMHIDSEYVKQFQYSFSALSILWYQLYFLALSSSMLTHTHTPLWCPHSSSSSHSLTVLSCRHSSHSLQL